jgi:hypothetical protein
MMWRWKMDKQQALYSFWSGFQIPAYDETSVPTDAELPYITYEVNTSDFDQELPISASIWYRSSSWLAITEKANEIERSIGRGGRMISYDDGAFWIRKRNSQRMQEPNDNMVRRILMNLTIEFID